MKRLTLTTASSLFIFFLLNGANVFAQPVVFRLVNISRNAWVYNGFEKYEVSNLKYAAGKGQFDSSTYDWTYSEKTTWYEHYNNIFYHRSTQKLDNNENIIEQLHENWDDTAKAWIPDFKYLYTYVNGKKAASSVSKWDTVAKTLKHVYQESWVYNLNGDIIQRNQESWDLQGNLIGTDIFKTDYIYSMGQVVQATNYRWLGNWQPSDRKTYTYSGNRMLQIISELWIGHWQRNNQKTYTYSGNLLIKETDETWDTPSGILSFGYQMLHTYNANNNRIVTESQRLNSFTQTWNPEGRQFFTYDNAGNMLSKIIQYRDSSQYINWFKLSFEYNAFNQVTREYQQLWDGSKWVFDGPHSEGSYDNYYHYELIATNVEDVASNNDLQIYPSPAKNDITLRMNFDRLQSFNAGIYDMAGRLVRSWNETNVSAYSKTIDISALPAGQYILNIEGDNTSRSGRFSRVD